jgi:ABC-type sugar transport system permease subunit
VLEAGAIDGATGTQAIFRIVLPLIRPAIFFVVANGLIGSLQIFDQAFILSNGSGGPNYSTTTAVLYIYNQAFGNGFYGVAAAASFVLFIGIFAATLLVRRLLGRSPEMALSIGIRKRTTPAQLSKRGLFYLILILYSLLTAVPFIWGIVTSFKTLPESARAQPTGLPLHWTLAAWTGSNGVLTAGSFPRWFFQ